jgi:hypothetical protein
MRRVLVLALLAAALLATPAGGARKRSYEFRVRSLNMHQAKVEADGCGSICGEAVRWVSMVEGGCTLDVAHGKYDYIETAPGGAVTLIFPEVRDSVTGRIILRAPGMRVVNDRGRISPAPPRN